MPSPAPLCVDDVIVPPEPHRATRSFDRSAEADALLSLSHILARSPEQATQQLVHSAMSLTNADSAGLTLEDEEAGEVVLRWIATAGEFKRYQNGTMPRDFSPCGAAIARRRSLVMRDPTRYYGGAPAFHVPVRSVLLVPFARRGRFVGTVWVADHTGKNFDTEQQRIVEGLATFASAIQDAQELRTGRQG